MSRFALLLGLLVLVAGCSTAPVGTPPGTTSPTASETPPPTSADSYYVFQNDRDETYEVTAYLGERPMQQFRVTFSNGTTKVVDQVNIPAIAVDVEPAGEVYATETYVVGPETTLFLQFAGCDADSSVWTIYAQENTSNFGYGQAHACQGYTAKEEVGPGGGGYSEADDYRDVLDDPDTVVRTLSANRTG